MNSLNGSMIPKSSLLWHMMRDACPTRDLHLRYLLLYSTEYIIFLQENPRTPALGMLADEN